MLEVPKFEFRYPDRQRGRILFCFILTSLSVLYRFSVFLFVTFVLWKRHCCTFFSSLFALAAQSYISCWSCLCCFRIFKNISNATIALRFFPSSKHITPMRKMWIPLKKGNTNNYPSNRILILLHITFHSFNPLFLFNFLLCFTHLRQRSILFIITTI